MKSSPSNAVVGWFGRRLYTGGSEYRKMTIIQYTDRVSIIGHNVLSDTESSRPPNESVHV